MDKKIRQVIDVLERDSIRQKRSNARIPPERRMMAITQDTGMFFSILIKSIRAKRVLEIGLSSGYSTLWLADAILSNTKNRTRRSITTIEMDPAKVKWASENFRKAGTSAITRIMQGRALEALSQLRRAGNKFDFVLIDADKENVKDYFDLVVPMVSKGGIIATDNMLFPEHYRDVMKRYAAHIRKNPQVQSVTIPVGHGVEVTLML